MGAGAALSHRDLEVWQKTMDLVLQVYEVSQAFPNEERYGLASQMRRAVVSIPANIAEGHGRGPRIFARYIGIAIGSAAELDTLLEIACRLNYMSEAVYHHLANDLTRLRKMLFRLYKAIHPDHNP